MKQRKFKKLKEKLHSLNNQVAKYKIQLNAGKANDKLNEAILKNRISALEEDIKKLRTQLRQMLEKVSDEPNINIVKSHSKQKSIKASIKDENMVRNEKQKTNEEDKSRDLKNTDLAKKFQRLINSAQYLEKSGQLNECLKTIDECVEIASIMSETSKKWYNWNEKKRMLERRKNRLIKYGINDKNEGSLTWVILPSGLNEDQINLRLEAIYQKRRNELTEIKKRLQAVKKLSPKRVWKGYQSFNDYFAYEFKGTRAVMLESLIYGNATFIIKEDWRRLSRLTKSQVSKHDGVTRLIHNSSENEWIRNVKLALSIK